MPINNLIASVSHDHKLILWSTKTGKMIQCIEVSISFVKSVAVDP